MAAETRHCIALCEYAAAVGVLERVNGFFFLWLFILFGDYCEEMECCIIALVESARAGGVAGPAFLPCFFDRPRGGEERRGEEMR